MEPNFQTSFIPKKPMVAERVAGTRSVGFFTIISLFIFFAVLLATGGLYFYKGALATNITNMEGALTLAQNRFEPSKINEIKLLDKRLQAATEILTKHISVTPIFKVIQAVTEKTVRFTKFSYDVGTDSKINVKMSGIAVNYHAMALQSDLFSTKEEAKNLIDPVFSNLTLDDKGNVHFDLVFSVDPSFVDYQKVLSTQTQS